MNLKFTGVGAEPKKIAILAGLLAVGAIFYYTNSGSGGSEPSPSPAPRGAQPVTSPRVPVRSGGPARTRAAQKGSSQNTREFRPSFKFKDIDPSSIDPTLHLNLLAQLQDVKAEAGSRSLFEIGKEPPAEIKVKEPEKIAVAAPFVGPKEPPPPPPPPPDPKAPPIPLKFYGFVNPSKAATDKRAFFLHGEDIVIAREGETVEKRYKIVRIGVNSAVVEDTQFKSNNQQTLPLEAEVAG
jgi:hypothetical protein